MTAGSSLRRVDHSHTPSDRNRSGSRAGSVKRAADSGGRPPRGRPDPPWEDDIRAVDRRVQYPDDPNASVQTALQALQRQSEADRDHMAMLKNAIETIYVSQQQQMEDVTSAAQRSDRIEGGIGRDPTITRTELQKMAGEMPARSNGAVDILIQP